MLHFINKALLFPTHPPIKVSRPPPPPAPAIRLRRIETPGDGIGEASRRTQSGAGWVEKTPRGWGDIAVVYETKHLA